MTKSIVQMLFEHQQAWCLDHFPGERVPVTGDPLSEGLRKKQTFQVLPISISPSLSSFVSLIGFTLADDFLCI